MNRECLSFLRAEPAISEKSPTIQTNTRDSVLHIHVLPFSPGTQAISSPTCPLDPRGTVLPVTVPLTDILHAPQRQLLPNS